MKQFALFCACILPLSLHATESLPAQEHNTAIIKNLSNLACIISYKKHNPGFKGLHVVKKEISPSQEVTIKAYAGKRKCARTTLTLDCPEGKKKVALPISHQDLITIKALENTGQIEISNLAGDRLEIPLTED